MSRRLANSGVGACTLLPGAPGWVSFSASPVTVHSALPLGGANRRLARMRVRLRRAHGLRQALAGRFRPHPAFLVNQILAHLDYLDETIAALSDRIEELLAPFAEELELLHTLPGVARRTAESLIAEVGVDMRQFPSDRHLASWAGLCPGNNESAGKHKSGKTRKGNRWLRAALNEAALAAIRRKDGALAARYRRIMPTRGHIRAVTAVAHALLRMAYQVLAARAPYQDPGPDYFDRRHRARVTRRAVQLLERQGYRVILESAA
jgi:transposase